MENVKTIIKTLLSYKLTISVAESLTAGKLQNIFATKTGASQYFLGGVTAYDLKSKVSILGINKEYAEECNCVSERTAQEMAIGASRLFESDIAISTTGYAEPYGDNPSHGFFSITIPKLTFSKSGKIELNSKLNREAARLDFCDKVLNILVDTLLEKFPPLEIEYKYLPSSSFNLNEIKKLATSVDYIEQFYFSTNKNNSTRLRIINKTKAVITSKLPNNIEVNINCPIAESKFLMAIREEGIVKKHRYSIPFKDLVIEVDVFCEKLRGLIIIEIEVPSKEYLITDLPLWIDPSDNRHRIKSNAELSFEC